MKTSETIAILGNDQTVAEKRVLSVELPTGKLQHILTKCCVTVRDFKTVCELEIGIPTKLQRFSSKGHSELQDWLLLDSVESQSLKLTVPIWWNKLVCASLEGEVENIYRRTQISMQRVTKEERIFVALFIACCRGHDAVISRLVALNHLIDADTVTTSGRTLLHAAAANSNSACLEKLCSLTLASSRECLTRKDCNKETPVEIAERLKNTDTANCLYKLIRQAFYEEKGGGTTKCSINITVEVERDREQEKNNVIDINEEQKTNTICPENTPRNNEQVNFENKRSSQITKITDTELVIVPDIVPNSFGTNESSRLPSNQVKNEESPVQTQFSDVKSQINDNEKQITIETNGNNKNSIESLHMSDTEVLIKCGRGPSPPSPDGTVTNKVRRPQLINNQPLVGRRIGRVHPSPDTINVESMVPYSLAQPSHDQSFLPVDNREQVQRNYLPSLEVENQNLVSRKIQTSLKTYENRPFAVSAPSSPNISRRSIGDGFAGKVSSAPVSPFSSRRASEPFGVMEFQSKYISRFSRNRRESVMSNGKERKKSRSICEVTLAESLEEHLENEARLERPWNAWILAKRKDSVTVQLTPPTDTNLNVPRSPTSPRRRSFEQWFTDKELEQLRLDHAKSQVDGANEAFGQGKHFKGKTFEEWMDDKRKEIERKREKEKELDESQKLENVKRERRRRESQVRYEKWLKNKEEQSLIQEQQLLDQAREKLTKLRKKWQEEDDIKKKDNPSVTKTTVCRTRSCPSDEKTVNQRVHRNRNGSLKANCHRKLEQL